MSEDPFAALLETARLILEGGPGGSGDQERQASQKLRSGKDGLGTATTQSNSDQSNATNVCNSPTQGQRGTSGRIRKPTQRSRESAQLPEPGPGLDGWEGVKGFGNLQGLQTLAAESSSKASERGTKKLLRAGSGTPRASQLLSQGSLPGQQLLLLPGMVDSAPLLMPPQPPSSHYDGVFTSLFGGDGAASDDDEGFTPRARKNSAPKNNTVPGGPCAHCGTMESPQWRRPLTRNIALCNACGIYFSRHQALPKRKKVKPEAANAGTGTGSDGDGGERAASPNPPVLHRQQSALEAAVLLHRVASGSLPTGRPSALASPPAKGRAQQRQGGYADDGQLAQLADEADVKLPAAELDGKEGVECDESLDEAMHFSMLNDMPECMGSEPVQALALAHQQLQQEQFMLSASAPLMHMGMDLDLSSLPALATAALLPPSHAAAMGMGMSACFQQGAGMHSGLCGPVVSPSRHLLAAANALNSPKNMLCASAMQAAPCRPSIAIQVSFWHYISLLCTCSHLHFVRQWVGARDWVGTVHMMLHRR